MTIRLPKDESKYISDSYAIARIMQKILGRENKHHRKKEYFWAIGLDIKNHIEYIELVTIGTSNRNILAPYEILSLAVAKKCKRLILCHNHPTGNLTPSKADIEFTKQIKKACDLMRMELLDHVIISETDHTTIPI